MWHGGVTITRDADGALVLSGAVAEGEGCTASGLNSHAEGCGTVASGQVSHAENGAFATGSSSHAEGCESIASGINSHAQGSEADAYLYAQHAQAGGKFVTGGDAQHSRIVIRNSITHDDTNWHSIGTQIIIIPEDTLWTFDILLSGASVGLAKKFSYRIVGCISNDGGTAAVHASTTTTIYESDADFDAQVVADDTYETLEVQVTDSTSGGDVVRWVADVRLCEVGFPAA